jgi:hypothetical protein
VMCSAHGLNEPLLHQLMVTFSSWSHYPLLIILIIELGYVSGVMLGYGLDDCGF